MKKLILAFIAITSISAQGDQAAEMYRSGLAAVRDGDVRAAEAAFREALRLRPGYADARYQLGELKTHRSTIAARARAKKLSEYKIDQIEFSAVELSEALLALAILVEEKSEKQFSPNFVVQDPSNKLGDRKISLQVKNVPAHGVLEMLMRQSGGVVKYEEHAIVIKPAPGSSGG